MGGKVIVDCFGKYWSSGTINIPGLSSTPITRSIECDIALKYNRFGELLNFSELENRFRDSFSQTELNSMNTLREFIMLEWFTIRYASGISESRLFRVRREEAGRKMLC